MTLAAVGTLATFVLVGTLYLRPYSLRTPASAKAVTP
jgi:hypothetical protein